MAIVTTNANIITGSATNTLGTLGRSIFNSTIGTFADKDTMNQVYGAMSKLVSSIETIDKTVDFEALKGRNKADDLFSILVGLDIKSSSDFMNKNREFMKRLMRLNKQERDITLDAIGVDVTGESNIVRNEYVRSYKHTEDNNYYEDYVKTLPQNQQIGDETTTLQLESGTNFNYAGVHNDLYVVNKNLYPDDENKGTFSNKWIAENKNSLLYKTKKLFNAKKINTIISRFHTNPNRIPSLLDNAKSKYGLSHGRNLLTAQAENGYNSGYVNGYDNPYCRTWTHHHQYDRYYKTIRPFSHIDDQGNYVDTISVKDFHQWNQFSDENDTNAKTKGKWGWKKEMNNGWQYSVLQDNGKVNITPKYVNGESSNIHTKQCMFSIENLAWRGYDPYSFEQALSWEQRGPLGGRIMWFPPYGITFNETTTTQWTNNTFLGRGEDVYTYTNTTRSGTLNFMMVVDHPSLLDYVAWTNENRNVTDTDILRFLAGCGEGDGKGLREFAKPTPLTDEFLQNHTVVKGEEEEVVETSETKKEEPPIEAQKPMPKKICFYVFYPNNYSGTYDDPYGGENYHQSKVQPIPYLLAGTGAQKSSSVIMEGLDLIINDDSADTWTGNGYEMGGNGLGQTNYISGTTLFPNTNINGKRRYWTDLGVKYKRTDPYNVGDKNKIKKWYYRIDGRYILPQTTIEEKSHYYNQFLPNEDSYADTNSYGFNCKIARLLQYLAPVNYKKDEDGNEKYILTNDDECEVYTLAEIAYVLYEGQSEIQSKLASSITPDDKRIERLKDYLGPDGIGRIEKVTASGYASAHGYSEINEVLAKHRAQTASNWFIRTLGLSMKATIGSAENSDDLGAMGTGDKKEGDRVSGDDQTVNAKRSRCAKVEIIFKSADITTPSTSDDKNRKISDSESGDGEKTDEEKALAQNLGEKKYVGYYPTNEEGFYKGVNYPIYKDDKGKKWYKIVNKETNVANFVSVDYASEVDSTPIQRYGVGSGDKNSLRYDQEYHFFKVLKQTDPVVYGSLMDKLQYFDPAFHSMTPEGFNGRLTFLQQCMRQGNTVSASDGRNAKSANNLAFGRAPYCVLRLGDFYNQMIVIDNLSITYDPLVWDLNVEGVGVQPLIANVSLSFKFIGGGDLTGPVRRLQNAMSFNYYANARLYDNRADRIERKWSDKTCGAIENDEILDNDIYDTSNEQKAVYNMTNKKDGGGQTKVSSFYTTQMYK